MIYLEYVWSILCELAPWLLFGAAIAGVLHVMMPNGFIKKHLGSKSWWSTIKAAFIGVPMPLCSCAVIPTGIGLKKDGASDGAAISFLISTPQTGVDSVTVAAGFLGWPFAIFKLCSAFIMGIIGGQLVHFFSKDEATAPKDIEADKASCCDDTASSNVDTKAGKTSCCDDTAPAPKMSSCCEPNKQSESEQAETASCCEPQQETPTQAHAIVRAFHFAVFELLRMIWLWLLIGVLISAALSRFLETDSLSNYAWASGISAMFIMLLISLPLYVCATASVPIAASLIVAGLPTGAALVFLMAGPATNVATIGAIAKTFGKGITSVYVLTVIIGSMGLGLVFEAFFTLSQEHTGHMHHEHQTWWAMLSAVILIVLLMLFAIMDVKRYLQNRKAKNTSASCCH